MSDMFNGSAMSRDDAHNTSNHEECWRSIGVWGNDRPRCTKLATVVHCHNCDVFHAASRRVYTRPIPDSYRGDWTSLLANEKTLNEQKSSSMMVFRLGDEWVAIPGSILKEISEMRKIHRLPHNRSRVLRGIVNIGGEIELCFSMGALLGIHKAVQDDERGYVYYNRMIVVGGPGGRFVFPVSEIGGITQFNEETIQSIPSTVSAAAGTYIKGVIEWQHENVGLLDAELLLSALERGLR